jgi:2-oxoglutarate dehydrogenase E2 component (dihydrolipoamide succinyltransferase)
MRARCADLEEESAMTDIVVPTLGESVTEATVASWKKKPGDAVAKDEALVELETDKVSVEVSAPEAGVLQDIIAAEGTTVGIGALLGRLGSGAGIAAAPAPAAQAAPRVSVAPTPLDASPAGQTAPPSVQRMSAESGVPIGAMNGSGKDGRVTKGDAIAAINAAPMAISTVAASAPVQPRALNAREERVKMSRLRQTIARRLKEAQNSAAMLTTFNEVDMSPIMAVRSRYKDRFEEKHGVKLGFMSFFVKACCAALQEIPAVNGEIEGDSVIYKNYYDLGIAVGTDKGLVVPVVRDVDQLSMPDIEKAIGALGKKAREGAVKIEDLQGATFTISNGGVYGSLMSTPILNAPQSGILGMHKIQDRPVVVNGQIVIRPMMYLALSYDHRLVDGKEAVTFLVRVKENLEDPERMLLDL